MTKNTRAAGRRQRPGSRARIFACQANYSNHPLNYLNNLFYGSCPQAFTASGLADFFVTARPVQEALYQHINNLFPDKSVRLREICAGARPDRWNIIYSAHPHLNWDVTLSDFSPAALPPPSPHYRTDVEDLFVGPALSEKYDVFLTTYGFDSLWFPEDVHYQKINGSWSKNVLGFPADLPASPSLINLAGFTPEVTTIPVNITAEPFGTAINKYYLDSPDVSFNFPGGLVNFIRQIFPRRMNQRGIFLSGDIAAAAKNLRQLPFETVGKVAKFHSSDYGLAKVVLEQLGFSVSLFSLNELLDRWQLSLPLDLSDHLFLEISKI